MGKDRDRQKNEYNFDQLLRGSLGCDDNQLQEKMRLAEETVDDSLIPPEPEDGFERMMAEVNKRGIKAHLMADSAAEEKGGEEEHRKVRLIGPIVKVALAVGILASVLVFTSITAGAKRSYEYGKSTRENVRNDVAVDNDMNNQNNGTLEDAYQDIHDQIGINVLKLGYIPSGMWYSETAISKRHATVYFTYGDKQLYIIQQLRTSENSANIISDRIEHNKVYNEWLKRDVVIEEGITENGEKEFSAQIIEGTAYYYIAGIIKEEEFNKIINKVFLTE